MDDIDFSDPQYGAILAALKSSQRPMTVKDLQAVGLCSGIVGIRALRALVKGGYVEREQAGENWIDYHITAIGAAHVPPDPMAPQIPPVPVETLVNIPIVPIAALAGPEYCIYDDGRLAISAGDDLITLRRLDVSRLATFLARHADQPGDSNGHH